MFVAIYSHEYGNTVRLFSNMQAVKDWKDNIARDYWADSFGDDAPVYNIGNEYFHRMRDTAGFCESFEVIENLTIESAAERQLDGGESMKQNRFNTLSEALQSENIEHMWDGRPIQYGQTVALTYDDGTRYGHYVSVYRDEKGVYERPVHYARG